MRKLGEKAVHAHLRVPRPCNSHVDLTMTEIPAITICSSHIIPTSSSLKLLGKIRKSLNKHTRRPVTPTRSHKPTKSGRKVRTS